MNKNFEQLLTLIATANDKFMDEHKDISSTIGILEQSLQASNAVTVDNIKLSKKLMFIILDAHPETVGIGVGKTGSEDFTFIAQYSLSELSISLLVGLMSEHLVI